MLPFVGVGLKVQELLEIHDEKGKRMLMKFAKMYPPEKMGLIVEQAKKFYWWRENPTAAFMKAVKIVNHDEKEASKSNSITKAEEAPSRAEPSNQNA
jgi:hypothetical protein